MRLRRPNLPNPVLVPRALAVLSCALALLAATPPASAIAKTGTATSVATSVSHNSYAIESVVRPSASITTRASRNDSLFSSARRLHILATVEILKRLLWANPEIQPERNLQAVLMLQPIFRQLTVPTPPMPSVAAERSLPPPERQFVIEHCLLAPPLA